MVSILNHKKWILSPLLSAGLVLTIFVYTGHGALLKDIRVGEYNDYTRIVFELDAPTEPVKIELQSAKRMAVTFGNTSAGLIRKIPLKKSPHIKDIQIWEWGNRLTALLDFDFDSFGHNSFSLTDPPRFVLDIHSTTNAPPAGAASPPATTAVSESDSSQTASHRDSQPAPQPDGGTISETTPYQTPELLPGEAHEPQLSTDKNHSSSTATTTVSGPEPAPRPDQDAMSGKSASQIQEPHPDNAHNPPFSEEKDQSSATPPQSTNSPTSDARPGRLQYYLVIVLVVITIVILMLLLLMLLVRHRWIEDKLRPNPKENPENPYKT